MDLHNPNKVANLVTNKTTSMEFILSINAPHLDREALAELLGDNPQIFKEPREFLFISDDGHDVYAGDAWFELLIQDYKELESGDWRQTDEYHEAANEFVERYVEEEAFDQAILRHTKVFSIIDVMNAMGEDGNIDADALLQL